MLRLDQRHWCFEPSLVATRLINCDVKGFHFPLFPPILNRLNNKELQKGILDLYNMSIC